MGKTNNESSEGAPPDAVQIQQLAEDVEFGSARALDEFHDPVAGASRPCATNSSTTESSNPTIAPPMVMPSDGCPFP